MACAGTGRSCCVTSQRREPRRHGRGTPRARAARPSSPRRRLGSTVPGEQATAKGQKGRKASGEKGSSTWRRAAEGPRGGCCAGTKRTPRMLAGSRRARGGRRCRPPAPSCAPLLLASRQGHHRRRLPPPGPPSPVNRAPSLSARPLHLLVHHGL